MVEESWYLSTKTDAGSVKYALSVHSFRGEGGGPGRVRCKVGWRLVGVLVVRVKLEGARWWREGKENAVAAVDRG